MGEAQDADTEIYDGPWALEQNLEGWAELSQE